MSFDSRGIWIDIHIGENLNNPKFTTTKILVSPKHCGGRSLQEYYLKYESDIVHNFSIRLSEAIKEVNGIKIYREAQKNFLQKEKK